MLSASIQVWYWNNSVKVGYRLSSGTASLEQSYRPSSAVAGSVLENKFCNGAAVSVLGYKSSGT